MSRAGKCARQATRADRMSENSAHEPRQFTFCPCQHLVDRLAGLQLCQHRGHRALVVDLHRNVWRRWEGGHMRRRVVDLADGIVVNRAFRRLDLLPNLEVEHAVEWRDVVALYDVAAFLGLLALAKELDQILGRALVLAERPDAPEGRRI